MPKGLSIPEGWLPWVASKAYRISDIVIPTTPNGHVYVCTIAGTSGAAGAEPTWPTDTTTVADNGATWRDCGASTGLTPYSSNGIKSFIADDDNFGTQMLGLKIQEAPRGASGAMASIVDLDHSAAPNGFWYMRDDTLTTADNFGTILRPVNSGEAWVGARGYKIGDIVNNGGNEYAALAAGTAAASGGPLTTIWGTDITDGTVTWRYRGPAKWGRWFRAAAAVV